MVSNCGSAPYNFDLFRNDTLHQHYTNVQFDTLIALVDSGKYQIRNIVNIYNDSTVCVDSIHFDKKHVVISPEGIADLNDEIKIRYNNPVRDRLQIAHTRKKQKNYIYTVYDILGNEKIRIRSRENQVILNMESQSAGIYFLQVNDGIQQHIGKIIKL